MRLPNAFGTFGKKDFCWCWLTHHSILIVALLIIGFSVRYYKISTPLADWHSWRQADTASVTREYVKHKYPLLLPHYQDLSNISNGLENPNGYRMVEFPLINYLIAQILLAQPSWNLVIVSRLVTIFFSLISIVALYFFIYRITAKKLIAFLSALVFAVLPYSMYYSRTILPDPEMLTGQILAIWAFFEWVRAIKNKKSIPLRFLLGSATILSFAFALLMKPPAIFVAPVFIAIAFYELGWSALKTFELYSFALSAVPLLWWRQWITQFPAGIPANAWLLNGNGIRFRPAWWRWLFIDRVARLMMGYWGVIFLFLGIVLREGRKRFSLFDWVTISWVISIFLYLVVFATGNVQHDYYQIMLIPVIAILFARGLVFSFHLLQEENNPVMYFSSMLFVLGLTTYMSWYEVSGYYNINHPEIVAAGMAVDRLTPPDARVIAPYQGDTAFLFQTNRTGWPIGGLIDEKIKMGAQYYVTTTEDDEAKQLEQKYMVIEKTSQYIVIRLSK